MLTRKMSEAMKLIGTELKDHLIISRKGAFSFMEDGLLENKYSKETKNSKKQEQLKMF